MEFEENAPVSDEDRRLADAKRISLQPLDSSVKPDEFSDEYTAAKHLRNEAVPNAPNDIEQDTARIQPAPGLVSPTAAKKAPSLRTVRSGVIGSIAFLVIVIVAVVLYTML